MRINDTLFIDEAALEESFQRASGPGGQNVNKVATAVRLRFDALNCPDIPAPAKARLRRIAGARMTADGVINILVDTHRSQPRNREEARARLRALILKALERPKPRLKTRPTLASKKRRLESKTRRGHIKSSRAKPPVND